MRRAHEPTVGETYSRSPIALGNGAFTPDGRLVVSHHPIFETAARVSIFIDAATLAPFPNAAWNRPAGCSNERLDAVLGVRSDAHGRIWMLDMGTRSSVSPKMVVWDCVLDRLDRIVTLPPTALVACSEPNDFVIDERRAARSTSPTRRRAWAATAPAPR